MLQALLYGILEGAPDFFPHFQSTYLRLKSEEEDTRPIEWTQSALEKVLDGVTSHPLPNTIWILIDGLDETALGKSVGCADCLGKFSPQEGSAISLKLLVATQPREPATNQLKEYFDKPGEFREITLQEENKDDIRAYIESFLNEDRLRHLDCHKMNLEDCRNTLFDSSRKVFLWVKLAERHVQKYISGHRLATISDFKKFLKRIPKDIEDLYKKLFDRMVQDIGDQQDEDDRESQIKTVRAMLQVAIQAVSGSLLLDEFQDAYVVPSPEEWADFCIGDSRAANAKMIISKFTANFLEVHFNGEDERVQLLHQTAVKFLKEQKVGGVSLNEDAYDKQLSTMGSACIYYLEQVSSNSNHDLRAPLSLGLKEMESLAAQINEYPLLPYALENFEGHVKVELHKDQLAALVWHMRASSIELLLRNWIDSLAAKCGLSPNAGDAPNVLKQVEFASNLLHVAVTERLVTAVKVALLAGADVDSQSTLYDSGERALCLLAMPPAELETDDQTMRAEVAICRLLLAHGAQPDAQTRFEGTALHYAGKYMRLGVVRELLRHHADVNPRDAKSMTPLHRAVIGHKPKNADPTELDARGHTPRSASKECVAALIQAGADLGAQEEKGETPIHWAAGQMNRVPILELLIKGNTIGNTEQSAQAWKRAANLKCRNKQSTPLHWASGHGYIENVKLLIQYGADVTWADVTGRTALHWAAKWGSRDVLQELLEALDNTGEDKKSVVNSKETNGHTPLIWACRWGHVECAELLIDHGADVNLSQGGSEFGGTPISWAATYNYRGVIDLLVGKGADMDETLLGWAAASGIIATFEHIRHVARHNSRELAVDGVGPFDKTPFMIAASYGRLNMVEYLCENFHIDVHRRDIDGNTALHFAARWKHLPMVKWLIEEAGLVINNANKHGDTALDCGLHYGAEEVNCYLIGKGGRRNVELRTMCSLF
ncbi:Neurogenic locus notch protein 2 [Fusarium falciforme]|nr:Neurogenic locus notch protein 2 [Fusarium falciforme]